jgi:hypothetical protein
MSVLVNQHYEGPRRNRTANQCPAAIHRRGCGHDCVMLLRNPKGPTHLQPFFSIWDAQGQIRFGGSCSSYVESAHGVRVAPNPSLPQRAAAEAAQFDMRR